MSPPLRSEDHVEAIIEGLRDGTVDAIATDHAPHHADEKELEFDQAPFGIVGLETAVGLALDRLVSEGVISLERMIDLLATKPARILGLSERGTLSAGAHADLTLLNPETVWTFDVSTSRSKSRNTPFDGMTFRGAVMATIVGGRVLYLDPKFQPATSSKEKARAGGASR
jgi:dihydroorotase